MAPKYADVMVDLETLGSGDGANIIQIGAVMFDPETGEALHEFNRFVRDATRNVDLSTALWWMKQPLAATLAEKVEKEGVPLGEALYDLNRFFTAPFGATSGVWALPASYDLPILKHAFLGKTPWHYRQERCARTVIAESGITRTPAGANTHDAVFDCKVQIADLVRARAALRKA